LDSKGPLVGLPMERHFNHLKVTENRCLLDGNRRQSHVQSANRNPCEEGSCRRTTSISKLKHFRRVATRGQLPRYDPARVNAALAARL
jgi:hypothetical protein